MKVIDLIKLYPRYTSVKISSMSDTGIITDYAKKLLDSENFVLEKEVYVSDYNRNRNFLLIVIS